MNIKPTKEFAFIIKAALALAVYFPVLVLLSTYVSGAICNGSTIGFWDAIRLTHQGNFRHDGREDFITALPYLALWGLGSGVIVSFFGQLLRSLVMRFFPKRDNDPIR